MRLTRRLPCPLAVAALLAVSCFAEKLEVNLVVERLVKSRLERGEVKPKLRQATIRELFTDVGCTAEEQNISKSDGNVICTLPGETSSTITVGGHFDFVDNGRGIVDDWSGTSLLPSLYQSLNSKPRKHTYAFVAFAQEERGLVGSSHYVKKLTKEQKELLRAFVNLECLGLTPVKIWLRRSTPFLVTSLDQVANAIQTTVDAVNVDKVGDDDTHPFLAAHIPVITIHSITPETWGILHSRHDRLDAINFDDYYKAYKLIAYYLAYLDSNLE
jgi:Zn-dependent M28 family amino/carboxypeptidase